MIKKNFIYKYFINFLIINLLFFPIAFYQFERPLISIESLIFSISGKFLIIGIFYELISTFFASLQVTPEIIFFSLWLNNINYNFIFAFMETYMLAILLIILYLFLLNQKKIKLNAKLKKFTSYTLVICIFITTLLVFNRPLIKLYFNDLSEVTKLGSTTYSLVKNINYQNNIREDLVNSNYIDEKFDINKLQLKKYNRIYIFVMESYPLFVKKKNREKVEGFLLKGLDNYSIKKQYKNWYPDLSTIGQEFYMFCGFPPKNVTEFIYTNYEIKNYLKNNNCLINDLKQNGYNLNYIHTYKSTFNNRKSYYNFFDTTYFFEDLINRKFIPSCHWYTVGICDYQVLDRYHELFDLTKEQSLYYFLTLNGHVNPRDYFIKRGNKKEKCSNSDLQDPLICKIYNNQIQFNKSLNEFILKNLKKNDILIAIGDTPPFFLKKKIKRLFINEYVPVFIIEKN